MNFIREWDSAFQTKENGFQPNQVSIVCNGKSISHNGYIFVYKDNPGLYFESKKKREIKNARNKLLKQKVILQFTLDDIFVRKYTYQELENEGYKLSTIQACCCGQNKTSNGYKWKYEESITSTEVSA